MYIIYTIVTKYYKTLEINTNVGMFCMCPPLNTMKRELHKVVDIQFKTIYYEKTIYNGKA